MGERRGGVVVCVLKKINSRFLDTLLCDADDDLFCFDDWDAGGGGACGSCWERAFEGVACKQVVATAHDLCGWKRLVCVACGKCLVLRLVKRCEIGFFCWTATSTLAYIL